MSTDQSTGQPATIDRRNDPRSQRSRSAVLSTSATLLASSGLGGFSVDEVSRRSGVAKTTIYRHWPTRDDLILEACTELDERYEVPDTGGLYDDLSTFLTDLANMVHEAAWGAVLPSIIDAAERSAEFASLHAGIQRGHASLVHQIIQRAIHRGQLPAQTNVEILTSTIFGPVFYRRWFSREPLDPEFVHAVTRRAIAAERSEAEVRQAKE